MDQNGTIIGYILIQGLKELWTDFPEAFVSSFYVRRIARQKGVGTQLLEAVVEEVKKRNCMRLFLENSKDNPIYEKKIYPKRGWKERANISIFEFPIK
ncbi:GNAT family N-acetyltransferase [Neochlamydia sp. AcF95]|uniref:GNAT family N-acetyltransferase n=1 Tax=Neochlamydia sp. AcF95 TaxID=2795734 RepID=UPI001BC908C5|nr:GNAT family N-acetyltransferase [Neochlamydia sp. AcF95]